MSDVNYRVFVGGKLLNRTLEVTTIKQLQLFYIPPSSIPPFFASLSL